LLEKLRTFLEVVLRTLFNQNSIVQESLQQLLGHGESETLEFKVAACWNEFKKNKDDNMIRNIIETVASFLNSEKGGILLIGVEDDGTPVGLFNDYKVANPAKQNRDGYELFLRDSINDKLGNDCISFYSISFGQIGDIEICYITIKPSLAPIYYQGNLFIRSGNQTRKLTSQETVSYLSRKTQ